MLRHQQENRFSDWDKTNGRFNQHIEIYAEEMQVPRIPLGLLKADTDSIQIQ